MKTSSSSGYKIILTKTTQKCRENNQELHHEFNCHRFSDSLSKQQETTTWQATHREATTQQPQDANRENQENPTPDHAAALFTGINVIMYC